MSPIPIFQNIADEIIVRLQQARSEILVSVPWFTDQSLFDECRSSAKSGQLRVKREEKLLSSLDLLKNMIFPAFKNR